MWWFKVEICILFVHIFECVHLHLLKKYVYLYIYIYVHVFWLWVKIRVPKRPQNWSYLVRAGLFWGPINLKHSHMTEVGDNVTVK